MPHLLFLGRYTIIKFQQGSNGYPDVNGGFWGSKGVKELMIVPHLLFLGRYTIIKSQHGSSGYPDVYSCESERLSDYKTNR